MQLIVFMVFLYSANTNIVVFKQNIYILHDVIFISDKTIDTLAATLSYIRNGIILSHLNITFQRFM